MHTTRTKPGRGTRRRAAVAVQVAVLLTVLIGFAAMTVDVGVMYNTRADLQRTADAAALAAASRLVDYEFGEPVELARAEALHFVEENHVMGHGVTIDTVGDVIFGQADYDGETNSYDFVETEVMPDAVRVDVKHTTGSTNGPVSLYFARIFGIDSTEISASAMAVIVPRDIALVADLSASHNDDSSFYHFGMIDLNAWEVWDGFPGGIDEVGGCWDPDTIPPEWLDGDGFAPQAAGPAWGYFKELGFGTEVVDSSYNPTADSGLVQLKYNYDWNNSDLESYLYAQGYIESEVDALMSNDYDTSGAWQYRVAAALGLAFWNSGHAGGLWETRGVPPGDTGNGNNWVGSSEIEWAEAFGDRSLSSSSSVFLNYINYMRQTNTSLYRAHSGFYCRFGVKGFVDYLLENRPSNSQTPEFAGAPAQPMQAVKDAVGFMADLINELDTDDQLSLEVYGTIGRHEVDLTQSHLSIKDRMNELQAGHYDIYTNIGDGIQRAIEELTSDRARGSSRKMIILLTDGQANRPSGTDAKEYARNKARAAANLGMRIFAVSVGAGADQSLMRDIADIGHGEHFHAGGSVEEYSAELTEIFLRLGGQRPVELIR